MTTGNPKDLRAKERERVGDRPLPPSFTTNVVGVTFVDSYPDNVLELMEAEPLVLVRRPDNQYDPNAVEVHSAWAGMLGHVGSHLAARLAPELDRGVEWEAQVDAVLISRDNPDNPGVSIALKRNTEKGNT